MTMVTNSNPVADRGTGSVLGDAWLLTRRQFWHWRAQPGALLVGLLFPVLVTVMFGALFGGAITGANNADNYYAYLMPGIFTMAMLFGLESTMTAVNADAAKGVTDRFRSLPISSAAVVLGRCMADMITAHWVWSSWCWPGCCSAGAPMRAFQHWPGHSPC
jgi:ABC-2 type transport system permease protein